MWYRYNILIPMLLCIAMALTVAGCVYQREVARLEPAERRDFAAYQRVMSGSQRRTYLAKDTKAQRDAYLHKIGVPQRFESLSAADREAALRGWPRVGMSAEALRFTWGDPYDTQGWTGHDEHWYYLGSSMSLAATGNQAGSLGSEVDVHLVDGRVVSWVDFVPESPDDTGGNGRVKETHIRPGHGRR